MKKKIISVGFSIPGYSDCFHNYDSSQSLLDADIVVFEPDFSRYSVCRTYPKFRGKPNFDENNSFRIKEDTERWKSEISTALSGGKTIFVFMARYEEVFVCTGERKISGMGENARVTTNTVDLYNNYNFLPVDIPSLVPKEGSELRPADNHHNLTAAFWEEFKEHIRYECYMKEEIEEPLFLTKTGKLPLGGLFHEGEGKLVLLPPVRYPEEEFTEWSEERGKDIWTEQAVGFGQKLVRSLQDIDRALRTDSEEIKKLQKKEAPPQTVAGGEAASSNPPGDKVFVVHGHDEETLAGVGGFLDRSGLELTRTISMNWSLEHYNLICYPEPADSEIFRDKSGQASFEHERLFESTESETESHYEGNLASLAELPALIVAETPTNSKSRTPAFLSRIGDVKKRGSWIDFHY